MLTCLPVVQGCVCVFVVYRCVVNISCMAMNVEPNSTVFAVFACQARAIATYSTSSPLLAQVKRSGFRRVVSFHIN